MQSAQAEGLTTKQFYRRLQASVGPRILVDKSPSYALDPSALRKAEADFEDARYIHLVRHPRPMIESFERHHMEQVLYLDEHPFDPRHLAGLIWTMSHRNIIEFLSGVPKERWFFRLQFEELVRDPTAQMEALCRRLGLAFDPAVLQPYDRLDGKWWTACTPDLHRWATRDFSRTAVSILRLPPLRAGRRSRCHSGNRPGKSRRVSAMPCPPIDRTTGALTVEFSLVSGSCANQGAVDRVAASTRGADRHRRDRRVVPGRRRHRPDPDPSLRCRHSGGRVVNATRGSTRAGGDVVKRLFDVVVAGSALILLAPLVVALAMLVRLRLGRPVIFSQQRPGSVASPSPSTSSERCWIRGIRTASCCRARNGWIRSVNACGRCSLDELPGSGTSSRAT